MNVSRLTPLLLVALAAGACKSAPPKTPAPATGAAQPSGPSDDTKLGWTLRLAEQRIFRDPSPGQPAIAQTAPASGAARQLTPAAVADLEKLALDTDPRLRLRAVVAFGRIGRPEAAPALIGALSDEDEQIRAAAAFALGLVSAAEGVAPLRQALSDPSMLVRGRAAEGLGLLGPATAGTAASSIATAFAGCQAKFTGIASDDEAPKAGEVDACRLALFALVRLRNFDGIAKLALDDQGRPVSEWWPIAYALQRSADPRSAAPLFALASGTGIYTPAFAIRGLTSLKDARVVPLAQAIALRDSADVRLRAVAVRALGELGGAAGARDLMALLAKPNLPRNLRLEATTALGALADPRAFDLLFDLAAESWPAQRAAALAAAAKSNPEAFLLVIGSLGPDKDWSVRAALAGILATLAPERVRGAIEDLLADDEARVRGPALEALARVGAPDLTTRLFEALRAADYVMRATAARLVGEQKPEGGVARLTTAYARGESDSAYDARAAALEALSKYGGEEAKAVLRRALADKEWPVRLQAADFLQKLGEATARPTLPAAARQPNEFFEAARVIRPPFSPHAYIDTRTGTIEIELNVVDAPLTSQHFMELARAGFFNGLKVHRVVPNFVVQTGDPRGDGEGGPGYTIRDEHNAIPYVRGTVGMALAGRDTGGSQFFIAVSPAPHLDGKYTVFARVVSGEELLDQIAVGDVIERIRIWDGVK